MALIDANFVPLEDNSSSQYRRYPFISIRFFTDTELKNIANSFSAIEVEGPCEASVLIERKDGLLLFPSTCSAVHGEMLWHAHFKSQHHETLFLFKYSEFLCD